MWNPTIIAILSLCAIIALPQAGGDSATVVEGATLVLGTGDRPIPNAALLYDKGRIVAIGQRGWIRIPEGTEHIDARGKWLIPGLIDMHVHLDEVIDPGEFLVYGVTSVRDVGSRLVTIQRIRARAVKGETMPRVYWMGRNIDEGRPSWWGAVAVKGAGEAPALLDDMARQGVDGVKVYVRAGPKVTGAVIREAHSRGWPVTGHLENTPIAAAARLGIDNLEHVSTLFNQLGQEARNHKSAKNYHRAASANLDSRRVSGLVNLLASRSVAVTPTLVSSEMPWQGKRNAEAEYAGWAPISGGWSRYWSSPYWDFINPVKWKTEDYRAAAAAVGKYWQLTARLHKAKVPLIAGTDTPAPWVLPGAGLLLELERYTRCGLTPMDAIRTATGRAGWALRKERQAGTLRPGCLADFVLLDADPLADIRNLRRVDSVYLAGKPVDLSRIRKRLERMQPPKL